MAAHDDQYDSFIGIDVGKFTLMVHDSDGRPTRMIDNTPCALRQLMRTLCWRRCLIVCEATGGYEASLLAAAWNAGIAIHRADARKVKSFIRSFGRLGKSDAIDARALASYGRERRAVLALWQPMDEKRVLLQRLVARRDELVAMRVAEKNRSKAPGSGELADTFKALVKTLDNLIADVTRRIARLIASCRQLSNALAILKTIDGVADITATNLIALMPELGTLTRRQAASLAGLAPHPNESGKTSGYRAIRGGRAQVRRAIYMAALTAARMKGTLGNFARAMIQRGKKPIVAITAVMRKIVTIANAKIRDQMMVVKQS